MKFSNGVDTPMPMASASVPAGVTQLYAGHRASVDDVTQGPTETFNLLVGGQRHRVPITTTTAPTIAHWRCVRFRQR
jgi:hypothetical protein